MGVAVHPTAVIEAGAELGEGCRVGPYSIVKAGASIGASCVVDAHVVIYGSVAMGARNTIFPFASVGGPPQDRRHDGSMTRVVIGDDNDIREHVTIHAGTSHGTGTTQVGSRCLIMASGHVAHDVQLGDDVTMANACLLGGHVRVADRVTFGGQVAIAPFVEIGQRAFIPGGAMVERSVPPFTICAGDRARVRALNVVGLQRSGVSEASIRALKRAFSQIFRGPHPRRIAAAELTSCDEPLVAELARWIVAHDGDK